MEDRYEQELTLSAAGFEVDAEDLWRDGSAAVGAACGPFGIFVGWIDVAWPHPHEPRAVLRDVVHLVHATASDLKQARTPAGRRILAAGVFDGASAVRSRRGA